MTEPVGWLELLWCPDVLFDLGAVINDDFRLDASCQSNQFFGFPIIFALAAQPSFVAFAVTLAVREVKPHDVDFAVVCQQLTNLMAHIFCITVHVSAFVLLFCIWIIAAWVVYVDGEVRMMPVDQGVIEANADTLCTECINKLSDKVSSCRSVGAFIIGVLAVEHTEAFMMLSCKNSIFHAGCFCLTSPFFCIIQVWIKVFKIEVVFFLRCALTGFYPLVACRHCVQPPVNEHSKSVMGKPCGISRCLFGYITGHTKSSSFLLFER